MSNLTPNEIEQRMLQFPDWDYYDNAIHAEFEFENFKDCFSVSFHQRQDIRFIITRFASVSFLVAT